eukprot:scaffold7682_cov82-Phaeocystis_antarctica.AAC.7
MVSARIAIVSTGLALPLEEGSVQRDAPEVGGGHDRLEYEPHGDPVSRVAAQRARQRQEPPGG